MTSKIMLKMILNRRL